MKHPEEGVNWSRRYKANLEKLASHDLAKVQKLSAILSFGNASMVLAPGKKVCWKEHGISSNC